MFLSRVPKILSVIYTIPKIRKHSFMKIIQKIKIACFLARVYLKSCSKEPKSFPVQKERLLSLSSQEMPKNPFHKRTNKKKLDS